MRNALLALALAATSTVTACSKTPRTEVMVFVRAEAGVMARANQLDVVVRGGAPGQARTEEGRSLYTGPSSDQGFALHWPVRIALVPKSGDASRVYEVVATASDASGRVAEARVLSSYLAGETLTLDVWLRDDCADVTCGADETCAAGACVAVQPVDPCMLSTLDGGLPKGCTPLDGGIGEPDASTPDGGIDAGLDAGSMDAGSMDAGLDAGSMDASSGDAGPPDAGPPDAGPVDGGSPTDLYNVVFVTSSTVVPGSLGGLAGADAVCRSLASDAGLPRPDSYVAFLSDSTNSAQSRLGSSRGWVGVDGRPFADRLHDLANGVMYYPIRYTETGGDPPITDGVPPRTSVATNTLPNLSGAGLDCGGYTTGGALGRIGIWRGGPTRWTDVASSRNCSIDRVLYCFGTGLNRPLDAPMLPADRRMAFLSSGTVGGAAGLSAFDGLCQTEADAAGYAGTFLALVMPDDSTTALSRFGTGAPWVRPDGVVVAESIADIANEDLLAPIAVTTALLYRDDVVWAGDRAPDAPLYPNTCAGWTGTGTVRGGLGAAASSDDFFGAGNGACTESHHLLCLQQ